MKWRKHGDDYRDALVYMRKRQQGLVSSFKTPWPKFNDAGIDGVEYHSITMIAARPGGGKTVCKDQLVREGLKINHGQNVAVLEFQLEMVGRNSKLREFSAITRKSYKYLCSAEKEGVVLDEEIIQTCVKYALEASKQPIDIIDTPTFVDDFKKEIMEWMETRTFITNFVVKDASGNETQKSVKMYHNSIVTLDHSVLLKKAKGQSTLDMLNQLGEVCTELKKRYPIAFFILSQLNRDITSPSRCENGKIGNYPHDGDIFGGDALFQHADMVIILDRPALRHISVYGPEKYLIASDKVLVAHFIKTRTGDTRMSFFEAAFEYMSINEMATPGQEAIKTRKKDGDSD